MNNIVGQPVEGEDFFNRESEVAAVWESLEQGNHVLLLAPRRVGKTSLALRVGEQALASGWRFAFVDVQRDRDELSLLGDLLETLKSAGLKLPMLGRVTHAISWARRSLKGRVEGGGMAIEIGGEDGQEGATLEALVDQLFKELEDSETKVLIAMDELPIFLAELQPPDKEADAARLRQFLHWFRALRLRFRKNVRWLLLGSVGLDTFVETKRLTPTINDLETSSLGAYREDTATRFLKELGRSKGFEMSDEVCSAILSQIGWPLPFYLQLVFHRLYASLGRPPRKPEPSDVEEAIRKLSAPDFYKHFEPWRGRLAEGLGPEEHFTAVTVLNLLCQHPAGRPRRALRDALMRESPGHEASRINHLLSTVLGQLERDGYLLRIDGEGGAATCYAFRSFLLRRYWYTREVE